MDELKIKTKFMRELISKLLSSAIRKKFGCEIDIFMHDIEFIVKDDKTYIHINTDAEISNNAYMKFTRFIDS